ncbi:MAG: TonB-dependent receptor [bacterium]|nr:TonB-dependent receptor [bacterium]
MSRQGIRAAMPRHTRLRASRAGIHSLCLSAVICLLTLPTAMTPAVAAEAAGSASPRIAKTDTVHVVGARLRAGAETRTVEPGQQLADVLRATPFTMVTRGAAGVGDLYADGFRRNDLTVTIDCERCETACPNRMDTRLGQVDLLEIDAATLARDGTSLQSGLGGTVSLRRSLPGSPWLVRGRAEGSAGHAEGVDGTLSVEGRGARLATRWRQIEAYTDAGGNTFADLYGFAHTPATYIREVRAQARLAHGDLRAGHERSRDILFPYLLMDERENDRTEFSGSWLGHRLYFNRTEHLMDNGLRRSLGTTVMSTDAENTMMGAAGNRYEVYARHWDADNVITPVANPGARTNSHMLPDVWRLGAGVRHALGSVDEPWLVLRLGLARTKVHDETQLAAFQRVHAGAELEKWSVPFGVTVSRSQLLSGLAMTAAVELAADAPGIEQQFIVVDKPGMSADWVGNPGLSDPLRATLRLVGRRGAVRAEVFATRVSDYPTLVRRLVSNVPCQTYDGVDAMLAGASVRAAWDLLDAGLAWNWGEQIATNAPLAEIQPVLFDLNLRTPRWQGCRARATYQHAAGQGRVDLTQDEEPTGAWNRLDLGLELERDGVFYALALDNATNASFTQHLSYQRNPFASGLRVMEPGRTARLSAVFDF